jgi:hypothetical protein
MSEKCQTESGTQRRMNVQKARSRAIQHCNRRSDYPFNHDTVGLSEKNTLQRTTNSGHWPQHGNIDAVTAFEWSLLL